MTDIVERLRSVADDLHKRGATLVDAPQGRSLYRDAATEIERLRARVEALRGSLKSASGLLLDAGDLEHADWCAEQAGDMEP